MEGKRVKFINKQNIKITLKARANKWRADWLEIANKKNIGSILIIVGFILFAVGSKDMNLLISVMGILIGFMGAGLVTLAINTDKPTDDVNIYIGKQLFEKGLEGFVLGVVVGALSIIF